jgi:hypothetical protein
MADSAVNIAMDSRASVQVGFPTKRLNIHELSRHLDNDVQYWLTYASTDPRDQSNRQQPVIGARERAVLIKDYLTLVGSLVA